MYSILAAVAALSSEIDARNRDIHEAPGDTKAFYEALDAYSNMIRFEAIDCERKDLIGEKLGQVALLNEWEHQPRVIEMPPCIQFLTSLPKVGVRKISIDNRACPICYEPYACIGSYKIDTVAGKLPCGHLACHKCLFHLFGAIQGPEANTCPMCRAVCFATMPSSRSTRGRQARSDADDWLLSMQVRRLESSTPPRSFWRIC